VSCDGHAALAAAPVAATLEANPSCELVFAFSAQAAFPAEFRNVVPVYPHAATGRAARDAPQQFHSLVDQLAAQIACCFHENLKIIIMCCIE